MAGDKKVVAGGADDQGPGRWRPRCCRTRLKARRCIARWPSPARPRGRKTSDEALTWHGKRDVRVDDVPDPTIQEPTDVDRPRSPRPAICGSDLHLYEVLGPFLDEGDILGHEPMGVVEEVGPGGHRAEGRRPRGRARSTSPAAPASCAARACTASARRPRSTSTAPAPSLFGYTKLYGQVPGGQAEYLRVPFGNTLPIKVPDGPPDDRFVFLSDVLPTAWQAVQYAGVPQRRHRRRARPRADRRHGHADRQAPRRRDA